LNENARHSLNPAQNFPKYIQKTRMYFIQGKLIRSKQAGVFLL